MQTKKLKDCSVDITGGQIMTRIAAKNSDNESVQKVKVVIPKAISSNGTIETSLLAEEAIIALPDEKKITKTGDIVIKLSTPYDAAMVDESTAGCIVPSFCAIIRESGELDKGYLLSFLNSEYCKDQLRQQVAGAVMSILSVGKVGNAIIPVPDMGTQKRIATEYVETQRKLRIINQIIALEKKRNDVIFEEMAKNNG